MGDISPEIRENCRNPSGGVNPVWAPSEWRPAQHRRLIAAGVVLGGDENQTRAGLHGTRLRLLRRTAKGIKNAKDRGVGDENANADRGDYGEAENERHEERNQDQPPCQEFNFRCRNPSLRIGTKRGFFNLPALTLAASDDPDAA